MQVKSLRNLAPNMSWIKCLLFPISLPTHSPHPLFTMNVLCLINSKYIHGVAPHYLRQTLNLYHLRRSLRSSEDSLVLETPMTKLKSFGDRAFSSYGPRIWNFTYKRIRDMDKQKQLKHHLFLKS